MICYNTRRVGLYPSLSVCLKPASWKPAGSEGGGPPSYKTRLLANIVLRLLPPLFLFPLLLGSI